MVKIGFFGDSYVEGVGDPQGGGWVGRLCQASAISLHNFGRQGDTSGDVLDRWQRQFATTNCDRLVFSFGANDCLNDDNRRPRVSQLDRLKNTKAILVAASQQVPTLLISPLPIADNEKVTLRIADLARQQAVVARANAVPYINIFSAVQASNAWYQEAMVGDGAHPSAGGYQFVADMLERDATWQHWLGV